MLGGKQIWTVFLLVVMVIYGCQDCDDCGPLLKDPTVNLKFINQDSLGRVEELLTQTTQDLQETISTQTLVNDSIGIINIQLQTIDLDIANGVDGLEELRSELSQQLESLQATFENLQELRLLQESEITVLNNVQSDILSGRIFIDSLVSRTDMTSSDFGTDSLTVFKFPLSVNRDSTAYSIFIGERMFELTLDYVRNFGEDERSRIEVIVSDIKIREGYTFQQVDINCEVCPSNETTITAYF